MANPNLNKKKEKTPEEKAALPEMKPIPQVDLSEIQKQAAQIYTNIGALNPQQKAENWAKGVQSGREAIAKNKGGQGTSYSYENQMVASNEELEQMRRKAEFEATKKGLPGYKPEQTQEQKIATEQLQNVGNQQIPNERIPAQGNVLLPPKPPQNGIIPEDIKTAGMAAGVAGLGAAATGAATGAIAGGPIGALIGGAGGLITGTIGGFLTKLTLTKKQSVKEAANDFTNAKGNMNKILYYTNHGGSPTEAVTEWNKNLAAIRKSQRELKEMTDNDVNKLLSGGGDELADVTNFLDNYNMDYEFKINQAINAPNPNYVDYTINPTAQEQ